jgi:putative phosphoesterase
VDTIIHAGDIDNQSVVGQLKNLSSSLIVVRGNADKEWAEHIPQEAWLEILGNKLFVIHNKGRTSCDVGDADIIIYGHSHKYSLVEKDRQIWLNPGCCDKRKKFQMSSKDLQKMKDRSDEICHEHGLSICEKNKTFDGHERTGITAWTKEKYHFMKDMLEGRSVKSYVYNTMGVVKDSMNRAASQEEFVKLLGDKGTLLTGRISIST